MGNTYIIFGAALLTLACVWSVFADWKQTRRHCTDEMCDHRTSHLAHIGLIVAGLVFLTLGILNQPIQVHPSSLDSPQVECRRDGCWIKYKMKLYENPP